MADSNVRSILQPTPLTIQELQQLATTHASPQALKKRKLNENDSRANESATDSEMHLNTESLEHTNTANPKKRKFVHIETIDITEDTTSTEDSSNSSNHNHKKARKKRDENDIFSTYAIKKILKSDDRLSQFQISAEAVNAISKATQFFADKMLTECIEKSSKNNALEYDDIAKYIASEENLAFLDDIVPKRIAFKKIAKQLGASNAAASSGPPPLIPLNNDNNHNVSQTQSNNDNQMDQD